VLPAQDELLEVAFAQIWQALGIRSSYNPIWRLSPFSNRTLMTMVGVVLLLQVGAIYLPWLNNFLRPHPLSVLDLLLCVAISAVVLVVAELKKVWERRNQQGGWLCICIATLYYLYPRYILTYERYIYGYNLDRCKVHF
jgi:Ca2+-transporting ATPase